MWGSKYHSTGQAQNFALHVLLTFTNSLISVKYAVKITTDDQNCINMKLRYSKELKKNKEYSMYTHPAK
jgi:hypothetical protein